jgi:hypothetical protein
MLSCLFLLCVCDWGWQGCGCICVSKSAAAAALQADALMCDLCTILSCVVSFRGHAVCCLAGFSIIWLKIKLFLAAVDKNNCRTSCVLLMKLLHQPGRIP